MGGIQVSGRPTRLTRAADDSPDESDLTPLRGARADNHRRHASEDPMTRDMGSMGYSSQCRTPSRTVSGRRSAESAAPLAHRDGNGYVSPTAGGAAGVECVKVFRHARPKPVWGERR